MGDSVEVLSAVIIIDQSDMKYFNEQLFYLTNLEQILYDSGHGGMIETLPRLFFLRTVAFCKNSFFWQTSFFKLLLPFITFMKYECAYFAKGLPHILCSYFDVVLAQL